ncbi:potassium channel family protein [Rhodococcus sp. G-MC3]|uniref:potassium channel family protein n=1 Tax=Rhodococcus sp. G-MC3 TaxID=3046209 RepID=UPI0024BB2A63|nr:potassium channel family protein [Rhodococcus sp. G-MC3]MDJ0392707.1 potassium channel family protein [Rhodococcus sp. G-MC3]
MITTIYFVAPMDVVADVGSIFFLGSVLLAVIVVCARQAIKIVRSDYPAVQAVEALTAVVPVYLIGFSGAYLLIAASSTQSFSEPLTRMSSLYFTLSVFSTVGFGDITASSDFARAAVSVQMVGNLVIIALGGRLMLAAVRRGQARKQAVQEP